MKKNLFPMQRHSILLSIGGGPFKVIERIKDNAYKLDILGEYNVSVSFNVVDLSPLNVGKDLRTNFFKERGMMRTSC